MKKNDKIPKSKTTDPERETRVLLEDIRKQVQTVAEGHGAIMRKLDEHTGLLTDHSQRLDRIETVLTDTNKRVKTIEKKVDSHDTRITKIEEKVFV